MHHSMCCFKINVKKYYCFYSTSYFLRVSLIVFSCAELTIRRINTDFLYVIIDVLLAAMSSKAEMVELIPFLNPKGQRSDIITLALQHVLGMSASEDGLKTIKDLATEAGDLKTNAFKHLITIFYPAHTI